MTLPNFLIIGAARSGTTALYHLLQRHPQVYLPSVKETNFFVTELEVLLAHRGGGALNSKGAIANAWISNLEDYAALFDAVSGQAAIGEVSPFYLIAPGAPERIRCLIPGVRLIAILRNPVDRAYSAHLMKRIYGSTGRDTWGNAVRDIYWGFYSVHLWRYYDFFDREQIRVYLYDDFRAAPSTVLNDLCSFLDIDPAASPDQNLDCNVSGVARNWAWRAFLASSVRLGSTLKPFVRTAWRPPLAAWLGRLRRRGVQKAPPLDPAVRAEMIEIYRADVTGLQDLLQRDLSTWLQ